MSNPVTLAADLGGTKIKLGVVCGASVLAERALEAESRAGLAPRLPLIAGAFRELVAQAGVNRADIAAVGMAFPSIVDPKLNAITSTNDKYPDAKGFDLTGWANKEFGVPITIENDAHAALAGEWQFGAGRGVRSCVIMTLGTGIGTSAVIDGVPLRGQHGQAGNLGGHFTVNAFGRRCVCGNIGCVETEASSWILPTVAREHPRFASSRLAQMSEIDYAAVFRLADEGDETARDLRDRSIRVWAAAAVNMVHAFDPEVVILVGGIMRSAAPILAQMQAYLDDHAWVGWGKVRVAKGQLGDSAALLGLSYLAGRASASAAGG